MFEEFGGFGGFEMFEKSLRHVGARVFSLRILAPSLRPLRFHFFSAIPQSPALARKALQQ